MMVKRCEYCWRFACECSNTMQVREGHIRVWRATTPLPPELDQKHAPDNGVVGHAHLHPRGMKHKRFRVAGVRVK